MLSFARNRSVFFRYPPRYACNTAWQSRLYFGGADFVERFRLPADWSAGRLHASCPLVDLVEPNHSPTARPGAAGGVWPNLRFARFVDRDCERSTFFNPAVTHANSFSYQCVKHQVANGNIPRTRSAVTYVVQSLPQCRSERSLFVVLFLVLLVELHLQAPLS
jgi:hypothetical protein